MDGFALKLKPIQNIDEPLKRWLKVGGLIAAGDIEPQRDVDLAMEIMTGAPIPPGGFDSVIKVEDVEIRVNSSGQKEIRLNRMPDLHENIRYSGEDSKIGDVLLKAGTVLTSLHLMILSTHGIVDVPVKKKLKIGVVSTGRELVDFKVPSIKPGQIRNSTAIYLNHELNSGFTEVVACNQVEDDAAVYSEHINALFGSDIDIVISTGAVSMGVFDFVKPALEALGAKIHFHKCAIRPGKPILFASLVAGDRTRYVFGVPGNPVSTAVGYTFFVKPFINFLLDLEEKSSIRAQLVNDVEKPEGLRCFFKAELDEKNERSVVRSFGGQASFMVSPFQGSNAWVVLPESGRLIKKNSEVEVYRL